jgi:hypothetical protein
MAIRGRGTKLGSGRGGNPLEPSPCILVGPDVVLLKLKLRYYLHQLFKLFSSMYIGVRNDQNKRQKLGIDDASKQKHNYTSDYEDTNEYYPSNDIEDAGDNHQAVVTNNVKK